MMRLATRVVDRRAEEHDALLEQAAVDVERPLTTRGLLDDGGYEIAHSGLLGCASSCVFIGCRRSESWSPAGFVPASSSGLVLGLVLIVVDGEWSGRPGCHRRRRRRSLQHPVERLAPQDITGEDLS